MGSHPSPSARRGARGRRLATLLGGVAGALLAGAAAAATVDGAGGEPSVAAVPPASDREVARLERAPEPVIVTGERLAGLLGTRIDHLALFAVRDGALAPIPFQVDERTPDGEYVFAAGKRFDASLLDGALAREDELVFMAGDAGDRARPGERPAGAGPGIELEVASPTSGGRAWAYVYAFGDVAPRSPVDYVSYDPAAERIEGETYVMQYTPGEERIFFSDVAVKPSAGGSGVDFVDRLKLRTYIETKLFFSITFDEDEWESVVTRYLDGPVRVIRQVHNDLRFLGLKVAPTIEVDAIYYPSFHYAPAKIQLSMAFPTIANEAWFKCAIDLNEKAKGTMRYYRPSPGVTDPFHAVDGRRTPDEEGLDPRVPDWHLLTGEHGTLFWRLALPAPLEPVVTHEFIDDESAEDEPEETPGSIGEIAERFDLFPLEKGNYMSYLYYVFPPRWKPGDEALYVDMIHHPVEVTAWPVAASAAHELPADPS